MVNKSGDKGGGVSARVNSIEGGPARPLGPHRSHQDQQRISRDNKPYI